MTVSLLYSSADTTAWRRPLHGDRQQSGTDVMRGERSPTASSHVVSKRRRAGSEQHVVGRVERSRAVERRAAYRQSVCE